MTFNSLHYAVFLPLVLLQFVLLRHRLRARNRMLLAASYYFYGVWDWRFLGLLVLTTFVDYLVALGMGPAPADTGASPPRRKHLLLLSLIANLGVLGFFKYWGFFVDSAARGLSLLGIDVHPTVLQVVLPVGISFYTFQSMSYTIDVYRGDATPERSFVDFALFVAFFPHLVAGPIQRAGNLLAQIKTERIVRREDVYIGTHLLAWGLFKKVVLADNVGPIADKVFGLESVDGLSALVGIYSFAIQIYCDFSGYSDMARGSARLMGFTLMENFRLPYWVTNATDFWRRWHISLSNWLRDYLYRPLGGNRRGGARTYVNIMITMVLGGLWHGAAWNFVLWGTWHGTLLCLHRSTRERLPEPRPDSTWLGAAWWLVRVTVFFHLTCFGWLLFRARSLGQVGRMMAALTRWSTLGLGMLSGREAVAFTAAALTLILAQALQHRYHDMFITLRAPLPARGLLYAAAFLGFVLFGNFSGAPFIYFQF